MTCAKPYFSHPECTWSRLLSNPFTLSAINFYGTLHIMATSSKVNVMKALCILIVYSLTLEVRINVPLWLLYFQTFFQGLRPYSGLHRAYLSNMIIRYKWGYAYSFCRIFQGLCLLKGVCLFFIPEIIQCRTSIKWLWHPLLPDNLVVVKWRKSIRFKAE